MVSPLAPSLWVLVVVLLLLLELRGSLQRCIFDEVQAQVSEVTPRLPTGPEPPLTSGRQHSRHPGWRRWRRSRSPSPGLSALGQEAPPTPAPPQPIRIHTWTAKESDNLSDGETVKLKSAVEEAVRTVSSLLSVTRSPGPLLLSRDVDKYCKFIWSNSRNTNYNRCGGANSSYRNETCLDVTIPDDHLAGCDIYPEPDSPHRTVLRPAGAGVSDADFLLYLHIEFTDRCRAEPDVLAYAVHCRTDTSGRPVAGVVVMCRDRVTADTYNHQAAVQTVIHELFHALGFSKHLFHTWRDCSSSSQVGVGCFPRGKVIHSDGSGQMRIYTPSVVSALQNHLLSADPELGGPLENLDAAAGRASSHWESRVLRGSIMAAALEDWTTVRIDPVTLAALQDTGWYTVNLSRAQSLVWGSGEGATFGSVSTCHDNSSSFFCTGSELGCHFLHLHKGECQTDLYLEGCRVFKPLKSASECWRKENSRPSAEDDLSGEMWGLDSRCFLSSLNRQSPVPAVNGSVEGRCYRHRCTGPNRFQVQVSGSEWVDCPAGGATQVKGFHGSVLCPDRRLCLYPDITAPSDGVSTFPASNTSQLYETLTSVQDWTWSLVSAATALSSSAALCLLAALIVSHRKCVSCSNRIHTETQHHRDSGCPNN